MKGDSSLKPNIRTGGSYNLLSKDPSCGVEMDIRRITLKNILVDDKLYHWIAEDLFLKCLSSDQVRVAMSKVHEDIFDTHQSSPKMKWLFKRAGLY
jgi:hypothetical protein